MPDDVISGPKWSHDDQDFWLDMFEGLVLGLCEFTDDHEHLPTDEEFRRRVTVAAQLADHAMMEVKSRDWAKNRAFKPARKPRRNYRRRD